MRGKKSLSTVKRKYTKKPKDSVTNIQEPTTQPPTVSSKRPKNTPALAAERDRVNSMSSTHSRYAAETAPFVRGPNTNAVLQNLKKKYK